MKQIFKNLAALGLSALVLFSTVSFSVGMHFCGSNLVDVALNEEAHGCGMDKGAASPEDTLAKAGWQCCADVLMAVDGQEELQLPAIHLPHSAPVAILSPTWIPEAYLDDTSGNEGHTPWYSPPPIVRDIPVLHQTFLI